MNPLFSNCDPWFWGGNQGEMGQPTWPELALIADKALAVTELFMDAYGKVAQKAYPQG
ncbi:hypothetical protein YDYSG_25930 [Paenibacillus tyrfis]|uniref:hypothetical protein n=1 Tax=Paenibacillus tyrfis TaxID=1501230 RepID=UPI0024912FAA|nr:hypothetical protein [Paenibacillus tyrfis]GLI06563.1 hypothetical protein YDYSG_25930 [Paenibacillus tyrfis]